jgi:predicted AAA+ superfamily ATPase
MQTLIKRHNILINETNTLFTRYLYDKISWDERLIGIKGSRGVGKTTMILQYIKNTYGTGKEALYITLDDLYFSDNKLIDLADEFVASGGIHLFIDEVHKYENWAVEIKNIYDYHSKLKIVFTGSSLLEILNSRSDLSRRALAYKMQGLSFREFLSFKYNIDLPSFSLDEILLNHESISLDFTDIKPLQYFDEYLKIGYFPFFGKEKKLYFNRLREIINMILEIELPKLRNVEVAKISKVKQLLYIISESVPFKPNISSLSQKINISRNTLLEYIYHLNDANLINALKKDNFGISNLQKPEKIYLENTNFIFALSNENENTGNIRETFFLNQVSQDNETAYSEKSDFFVNKKYTFEVGGKNKQQKQIRNIENSFIVKDKIELGIENQIPLWLFGFLY